MAPGPTPTQFTLKVSVYRWSPLYRPHGGAQADAEPEQVDRGQAHVLDEDGRRRTCRRRSGRTASRADDGGTGWADTRAWAKVRVRDSWALDDAYAGPQVSLPGRTSVVRSMLVIASLEPGDGGEAAAELERDVRELELRRRRRGRCSSRTAPAAAFIRTLQLASWNVA